MSVTTALNRDLKCNYESSFECLRDSEKQTLPVLQSINLALFA